MISIDGKHIVVQTKQGPVTISVEKEVRLLELAPAKVPSDNLATLVELTDGSQIYCKPDTGLAIKENKVTLTLLKGLQLELPLTALSYALKLKCSHDASLNIRENADWKACLKAARTRTWSASGGKRRSRTARARRKSFAA